MGYYEIDRCPHCRKTLEVRRGAGSDTTIGPPVELCPYCKEPISTGRTEWADKSCGEQVIYCFRVAWWVFGGVLLLGIGGGLMLTVMLTFWLDLISETDIALAAIAICM